MRFGDYKFIRHYENGQRELYNLKVDIGESDNLVSRMPEKAEELERMLNAWLVKNKAYILGPDPEFYPANPVRKKRKKW